jgi:hypothetical protein
MGDALNTGPTFVSGARLARLEQFPRSKRFPLLVAIVRSTTGYSITVKRITYQHPTAEIDQFCVIATVTKPRAGEPVEHRRTVSTHAVQIDREASGSRSRPERSCARRTGRCSRRPRRSGRSGRQPAEPDRRLGGS